MMNRATAKKVFGTIVVLLVAWALVGPEPRTATQSSTWFAAQLNACPLSSSRAFQSIPSGTGADAPGTPSTGGATGRSVVGPAAHEG